MIHIIILDEDGDHLSLYYDFHFMIIVTFIASMKDVVLA